MKRLTSALIVVGSLSVGGCDCPLDLWPFLDCDCFSFEADLQDCQGNGTDLSDPPVEWSIERSEELARTGDAAVKLTLNNTNDAGKIWIERQFSVKPNCKHHVQVVFSLASADFGTINLWRIITGVTTTRPTSRDDLTFQDNTGNGSEADVGHVWLDKGYSFDVESGADGELWVAIGVWGTWETARTYYVDDIRVCFSEK